MILWATLTVGLLAILAYLVHLFDAWLGILAFKYPYLGVCVLVAFMVAAAWLAMSRKASVAAGLTALALLLSPYFLGRPSARILRGVLVRVQGGMNADEVVRMVRNAYSDSDHVMPRITRDDRRIHVSLLTQDRRDCTAAVFYLSNGVVVNDEFCRD